MTIFKKPETTLIVGVIMLSCLVSFSFVSENVGASTTLYVGGVGPSNYTTIQSAIENATAGDTVFVYSGTYKENVIVNKSLNLIGENKNTTKIEHSGTAVLILVNWVNITGFKVNNSGLGIYLMGADNCFIYNNLITNISNYGILLETQCNNNTILANNASYNYRSIVVYSSSNYNVIQDNQVDWNGDIGIGISTSSRNNSIVNNHVTNNTNQGIWLSPYTSNNTVSNNIVSNNLYGIYTRETYDNNITQNTILFNTYGIYFYIGGNNNIIYHNNFINNTNQARGGGTSNVWDNGYPSGGNYWSNYAGIDIFYGPTQNLLGSDGIGDTNYTNITGGSYVDKYPLTSPFDYTEYIVPLQQGWNLISHPVRQLNESIDSVLESIPGKWDYIQKYDASDASDYWKSNLTYRPGSLNDLSAMNHQKGYWINITEPGVTLIVKGDKFGSALSIPLKAGWNLVGYPSLINRTVQDALATVPWESVEEANAAMPYGLSELGPLGFMLSGHGYWVKVSSDCVWTVDW